MWGGADYEQVAQRLAPVHELLVERLALRAGERLLDVATGTGEVALRAARAGVDATGLDISEPLLEQARVKAEREGLGAAFEAGDAQALPYGDASFDVVASCFGVMFAPDAERVAAELARVLRPGGRLGLTTWAPNEEMARIYARFQREPPAADMEQWGRPGRVRELLEREFELAIETGTWRFEAGSAEELWHLAETATPPTKAFLATLDDARRAEYRAAMLEHWNRYRTDEGVSEPRDYLLVLGTRR
jgi:ubiquinone/menaquinone biosynthesis C-methylase UbiE